jgi:hypothetical protein
MKFDVVGQITGVEVVASGSAIRVLRTLRKVYGPGRWRKLKGVATILLPTVRCVRSNCIGMRLIASGEET